jgi:hypothetical protein
MGTTLMRRNFHCKPVSLKTREFPIALMSNISIQFRVQGVGRLLTLSGAIARDSRGRGHRTC